MGLAKSQYRYSQSKTNRDLIERFEIEESIIGFNHSDFRERIKDEIAYIGLDLQELALKCRIDVSRMSYVMNKKNSEFLPNEIKQIKKILGM